ncbi:MAG: ATP-binding cassette domain-containing protein [Tissierellia bacterium]|nr:ATP-binding cassette domain-containing protein [Tissierellia bacterium]
MSIDLNIQKSFKDFTLNCQLKAGNEIIGLLGSSGSGKSLTLKSIAGIVMPDQGHIIVDQRVLYDSTKNIKIPARDRKMGYLFQNYALFPRMTIMENITTCLKGTKQENIKWAKELLGEFQLEGLGDKYPHQLSGGQQQRAAMARMMSIRPKSILLDEPFSALDTNLKWKLENSLGTFLRSFSGTTVLVTHNKDEAYRLCDKIAVISNGTIQEFGTKEEIFQNPKTAPAAAMLGYKNIAPLEEKKDHMEVKRWKITLPKHHFKHADDIFLWERDFYLHEVPDSLKITGKLLNIIHDRDVDIFLLQVSDDEQGLLTLEFPHEIPSKSDPKILKFKEQCGKNIDVYYKWKDIRQLVDRPLKKIV